MFETRTVPRFFLLPALAVGAVLVVAWSHGPWGDHTALKFERGKYAVMRDRQHQASAETHRWKAVFDARGVLLAQARRDGARAVAAAAGRARAANKASFEAGVVAGRVLERKAHALRSRDPVAAGPDVRVDGVFVDFRELWRGDGAPAGDGEGVPAGSDGAGP